jgi:hypothetical protein
VKADISRPLAYAIVVGVLLAFRLYWARMRALPRDRDAAVGRRRDVAL